MHTACIRHHHIYHQSCQSLDVLIITYSINSSSHWMFIHACHCETASMWHCYIHHTLFQSVNILIIDHPCLSLWYSLHVALLRLPSTLPVIKCSDHRSSMRVTVIAPVAMISMFACIWTRRKAAQQRWVGFGNTSLTLYASMHSCVRAKATCMQYLCPADPLHSDGKFCCSCFGITSWCMCVISARGPC